MQCARLQRALKKSSRAAVAVVIVFRFDNLVTVVALAQLELHLQSPLFRDATN